MFRKILLPIKKYIFCKYTPYTIDSLGFKRFKVNSTKKCPICGNKDLLRFTSLNEKICTDCEIHLEWKLEKDQKSIFSNSKR